MPAIVLPQEAAPRRLPLIVSAEGCSVSKAVRRQPSKGRPKNKSRGTAQSMLAPKRESPFIDDASPYGPIVAHVVLLLRVLFGYVCLQRCPCTKCEVELSTGRHA